MLHQFEDEGAPTTLDGFKGRSFAIGPIAKYTAGSKENPVNIHSAGAPEFDVRNRLKGNGVYLGISGKF